MPSASKTLNTKGSFKYIDPASFGDNAKVVSVVPWGKVDGGGISYKNIDSARTVTNLRPKAHEYSTNNAGFATHAFPSKVPDDAFFAADDSVVRGAYYAEVEAVVRSKIPGVEKVVIFDHTVRRRHPDSPRQPVQALHVDQTPAAADARVRRHLPEAEAEARLTSGKRYQLINVWRPIGHEASDHPLAVIDWRSTSPEDFVHLDLLYPDRTDTDDDDRGKEVLPAAVDNTSSKGYSKKGENYAIRPNEKHEFFYVKDMKPDETMFIKCFDSWGQGLPGGKEGIARCTPHTAFSDPATPADAKGRQSIEVRCLVFHSE